MIPDIIGKPHTWCYKVLGWRLKLTKSAFRRISQLKLVPAPGHWSGRRCLGSGRLRVSELAAGSLAAAYLGLETPQTGCMQCCSYLSGLQRFTDHTQHTSCLCKTSHPLNPLRGFTGAHCCRGGYQGLGGILFTVAGCWLLQGDQVLRAAVCLVPAVLLPLLQSPRWPGCWPAQAAAAVSGQAGCSACVVCSTATLCTTLSRQAVSTAH